MIGKYMGVYQCGRIRKTAWYSKVQMRSPLFRTMVMDLIENKWQKYWIYWRNALTAQKIRISAWFIAPRLHRLSVNGHHVTALDGEIRGSSIAELSLMHSHGFKYHSKTDKKEAPFLALLKNWLRAPSQDWHLRGGGQVYPTIFY